MEGLREPGNAERQPSEEVQQQIEASMRSANDLYWGIYLDLKDGQLSNQEEKRDRLKQLAAAVNAALELITPEIEGLQSSDPAWRWLYDRQRLAKELGAYAVRA